MVPQQGLHPATLLLELFQGRPVKERCRLLEGQAACRRGRGPTQAATVTGAGEDGWGEVTQSWLRLPTSSEPSGTALHHPHAPILTKGALQEDLRYRGNNAGPHVRVHLAAISRQSTGLGPGPEPPAPLAAGASTYGSTTIVVPGATKTWK